jgi:voltage-gated potassium channel
MRAVWPFVLVLIIGILVFLMDLYSVARPLGREVVLIIVSLAKSVWFVRFVIRRIRNSTQHEFYFDEFMAFIGLSIILFALSYAIDFYCLYQIRPDAFLGLSARHDLLDDFISFFYFSITNFTTAGLGDILPNTASARIFIASELIISFFFTIFILANLAMLRESFARRETK